jgi:hypothetical protein
MGKSLSMILVAILGSAIVGGSAIFLHNPYVLWGLLVILAMTITIGEYGE